MAGKVDEISLAIGRLEQGMKMLAQDVRDNQEENTREHRIVHDIVVATSEAVRNLTIKVAVMEPLTDDYREKRAERRGMKNLVHVLYVTLGGIAGGMATWAMEIFKPHS